MAQGGGVWNFILPHSSEKKHRLWYGVQILTLLPICHSPSCRVYIASQLVSASEVCIKHLKNNWVNICVPGSAASYIFEIFIMIIFIICDFRPMESCKNSIKYFLAQISSCERFTLSPSPCVSVHFSSVSQSCPTFCDPIDWSTPGFPVHHQLLELAQTHVHRVGDAIKPSHPLSSPSHVLSLSQHQGLFQWVSSSHQLAKVLELQHQSFQWIFRTDFF